MFHFIFVLVLLLFGSNDVHACYLEGTNPDSAYKNTVTNAYYADPGAACASTQLNPIYAHYTLKTGAECLSGTCAECIFCDPDNQNNCLGVQWPKVTGDTAYGACDGSTPVYASVCNDGQIISDYRDPACSDNTQFDPNGYNIAETIDINTDTTTVVNTSTDIDGNTVTETITTDTTTETTTLTGQDGTNYGTTAATDETVTTETVVTDPGGTIISSTTNVTNTTNDNTQPQGSASGSGNCATAPYCTGDLIACAQLYQTWQSGCSLENELQTDNGVVTGDGSCSVEPTCTGDNIQCAMLINAWHERCDFENTNHNDFSTQPGVDNNFAIADVTDNVDFNMIPAVTDFFGYTMLARSCPADRALTLSSGSFTLPYTTFCNLASGIAPLIIAFAYLIGVRNIYNSYIGT